jgi:NAD(P)-dependent dehydrogenase (short-subunit alcohol dehydrogenase family)
MTELAQLLGLEGTRVVLAGAGGGLGREAARVLRAAGARTVGIDRNVERLAQLCEERLLDEFIACDLNDDSAYHELSQYVAETDVLVSMVGVGIEKPLAETSDRDIQSMMEANVMITARLARMFVPAMAERRRGKVITFASVLANHPVPTITAYAASKAAVVGFTRALAIEFADRNVQINALAPGYMLGPKHEAYFASEMGQRFARRFMPTTEPVSMRSVAGALLFLASLLSNGVTGQVLVVDDGYSIW